MKIETGRFLVTGAASGLGAATAGLLIEKGGYVVLADLNVVAGSQKASELGERARFIKTDITNDDDVQAAIKLCQNEFGGLDGAVNCAGLAPGEKLLGKNGMHTSATFMNTLRVNLFGTFNVLRFAADGMQHNAPNEDGERGVIINTASIAAFEGQVGQIAYGASKAGVVGMMLPAARELAKLGIRIATIAPGIFETPMVGGMSDEVQKSLASSVPFPPRLGRPSEYAALALHVLENPMINGEVIRIDGAVRMGAR